MHTKFVKHCKYPINKAWFCNKDIIIISGYSKSVLNEVRNYMERSELDDVNALDDQAGNFKYKYI